MGGRRYTAGVVARTVATPAAADTSGDEEEQEQEVVVEEQEEGGGRGLCFHYFVRCLVEGSLDPPEVTDTTWESPDDSAHLV